MFRWVIATVVLAFLASGCVREVAEYPSQWQRIKSRAECAALAGTYYQKAERVSISPGGGYSRFTWLATGTETAFSGDHVTLAFPQSGVFSIQAGEERRYRLGHGEAACVNGQLNLNEATMASTSPVRNLFTKQ
jgi:hypothetical protein